MVRFVDGVTRDRTRLNDEVTSRIDDPTVAALLIAKASLAAERGVDLRLLPDVARWAGWTSDLSRDLTTVVGNLVDNALDAVDRHPGRAAVEVLIDDGGDAAAGHRSGTPVPGCRLRTWRTCSGRASPPRADQRG